VTVADRDLAIEVMNEIAAKNGERTRPATAGRVARGRGLSCRKACTLLSVARSARTHQSRLDTKMLRRSSGCANSRRRTLGTAAGAVLRWLAAFDIETAHIAPGKPWQNGTDESFNGRLPDECQNMEWFRTRREAIPMIET